MLGDSCTHVRPQTKWRQLLPRSCLCLNCCIVCLLAWAASGAWCRSCERRGQDSCLGDVGRTGCSPGFAAEEPLLSVACAWSPGHQRRESGCSCCRGSVVVHHCVVVVQVAVRHFINNFLSELKKLVLTRSWKGNVHTAMPLGEECWCAIFSGSFVSGVFEASFLVCYFASFS